jgi:hypothetical protein
MNLARGQNLSPGRELRSARGTHCAGALALGALGLIASSCSHTHDPETIWPGPSWSSAHFVYHVRPNDSSVDAGVLNYLEANATLIAQGQLGLDPAQWGPIEYFKYRDDADFTAGNPCGGNPDTEGCCLYFSDGRIEVHSPLAVDPHELVHAYARTLGFPPLILVEGLAVSLSCDPSSEEVLGEEQWATDKITNPWTAYYPWVDAGAYQYLAAGLLTTWLVDHAGMQSVLSLYKQLPQDTSSSDFAAAVLNATGTSTDDAWQAMVASKARRPCINVIGCTALDPTSNPLERNRVVSTVPRDGAVVAWTGAYALAAPPAVRACAASDAVSTDVAFPIDVSNMPSATALFLPNRAGYVLTTGRRESPWDAGPTAPTDYSTTDVPPGSVAATCAGLQPIPIADDGVRVQIWPAPAPLVFGVDLTTSQEQRGAVQSYPAGDPLDTTDTFTVDVCTSCDSGTLSGCAEMTPDVDWMQYQKTGPVWLRVSWNPPDPTELLTVGLQFY